MAVKLKSFEFTRTSGRYSYPWDQWTDGSIWKVKRGEDFNTSQTNFGASVYDKARKIGKKVRVKNEPDDVVVFQFFDPSADEAEE